MTDTRKISTYIDRLWDEAVTPTLVDYIRIPNKSPGPGDAVDGARHMDSRRRPLRGLGEERRLAVAARAPTLEVVRLEVLHAGDLHRSSRRGADIDTVLLYGHLDKQPEMTGWSEDLGPWTPVLKGDRLYGRGGADDGYAMFGALSALLALQDQGVPHARCVILIEACEESGSYDLPAYVEHLASRIGDPSLVVCLDSGCGNYDQLWLTTSLRGMVSGVLRVDTC